MTLLSKEFFNLTPVGDTSIDEIGDRCLEHFGKLAATIEKEMKERDKAKVPFLTPSLLLTSYGRSMSINLSTIVWEEDIVFNNEKEPFSNKQEDLLEALASYVIESSNKELFVDFDGDIPEKAPRGGISAKELEEAYEKIRALFGEDVVLGLKILKLGNLEYYCYCINTFIDRH